MKRKIMKKRLFIVITILTLAMLSACGMSKDNQALAEAKNLTKIGLEELIAAGLTNGKELVKILGNGELKAKLDVEANAFSKTAEEAIKAVGGNATII